MEFSILGSVCSVDSVFWVLGSRFWEWGQPRRMSTPCVVEAGVVWCGVVWCGEKKRKDYASSHRYRL